MNRLLQVVVADVAVAASFERECYTYNADDPSFQLPASLAHLRRRAAASRKCVSDEHYIATVLAANGLDNEVSSIQLPTYPRIFITN